jgi:ATP-dependent RNA helicase RhlE
MEGLAISLVSFDEEDQLKGINRLLKRDLPIRQVRGFEVDPHVRPMRSAVPRGRGRARPSAGGARRRGRSPAA